MRVRSFVIAPMRARRRAIASLLLFLYLPACTSWQVGKPTPQKFLENEQPEKVRVTQTDGSRVELMSPEVRTDSLVGTVKVPSSSRGTVRTIGYTDSTISIPLSEVQSVEVKKADGTKTGILVGGMMLFVVVVVAGAISYAESDPLIFQFQ